MTTKHTERAPSSRRGKTTRPIQAVTKRIRRRAKPDAVGSEVISPEERLQLVTLGAYFRAEARGFAPGREMDDWLEAESEVDARLGGHIESPDSF